METACGSPVTSSLSWPQWQAASGVVIARNLADLPRELVVPVADGAMG